MVGVCGVVLLVVVVGSSCHTAFSLLFLNIVNIWKGMEVSSTGSLYDEACCQITGFWTKGKYGCRPPATMTLCDGGDDIYVTSNGGSFETRNLIGLTAGAVTKLWGCNVKDLWGFLGEGQRGQE